MQNAKDNNFTFIHIIAALMVIIGHQFTLMGLSTPIIFGTDINGLGVRVLFLVSGYLVSASYIRCKSPIKYLFKRISRLYPPLFLCLLITIIVMRIITIEPKYYWESALVYFLHNIEMRPKFDLAGVFTGNISYAVNGSLWTLPIELGCYIALIPIFELAKLFKKNKDKVTGTIILLMLVALSLIDTYRTMGLNGEASCIIWDTNWLLAANLGIWFMIGVLFQIMNLKAYCNMQIALLLIVIHACLPTIIGNILLPYVLGYGALSFGLANNPIFKNTFKRDICYGMYLYAFPVQQLLLAIMPQRINKNVYVMLLFSIVITVLIAEITYYIVEVAFVRLCAKLVKR